MNISKESIVGEIVAHDYRSASVFKQKGIDFCCRGNRSIAEVCEKEGLNPESIVSELNQAVTSSETGSIDFKSWDLDLLADYIEKKHHRYVDKKIPEIKSYLEKVCKVHGERHPELFAVNELFTQGAQELLMHMTKEENILFPYLRNMNRDIDHPSPPFTSIKLPIEAMTAEHQTEGDRFRKISELTNSYTPPQDACTTYKVVFALLKEFEEDLHLHIHLENNILFPGAIALEKSRIHA